MINQTAKRSNEPVFWGLFGAGGTLGAIFTPVLIVLFCFILPFSSQEIALKIFDYSFEIILGKLFIFIMIVLPIWCSLHRLHHMSHDIKLHIPAGKVIFYGIALILTVIAFWALFL